MFQWERRYGQSKREREMERETSTSNENKSKAAGKVRDVWISSI